MNQGRNQNVEIQSRVRYLGRQFLRDKGTTFERGSFLSMKLRTQTKKVAPTSNGAAKNAKGRVEGVVELPEELVPIARSRNVPAEGLAAMLLEELDGDTFLNVSADNYIAEVQGKIQRLDPDSTSSDYHSGAGSKVVGELTLRGYSVRRINKTLKLNPGINIAGLIDDSLRFNTHTGLHRRGESPDDETFYMDEKIEEVRPTVRAKKGGE